MSDTPPVERRRQPTPNDLNAVRQDMANIADAVESLAAQTAALPDKEDVRHNTRQIVASVVVGIAVLVIAVALPLWLDRRDDQRSAEQRVRLERVAREIESCTTPEGECTKRNAANTAVAVRDLQLTTVFAAYCAINTGADTPEVLEACVGQEITRWKAENPDPTTTTTIPQAPDEPADESNDWPLGAIIPPALVLVVLAISFAIRKYQLRHRSPEGDTDL